MPSGIHGRHQSRHELIFLQGLLKKMSDSKLASLVHHVGTEGFIEQDHRRIRLIAVVSKGLADHGDVEIRHTWIDHQNLGFKSGRLDTGFIGGGC